MKRFTLLFMLFVLSGSSVFSQNNSEPETFEANQALLIFNNRGPGTYWYVEVDGKDIGWTPETYLVEPGLHTVEVFESDVMRGKPPVRRYKEKIEVVAGEKYEIKFTSTLTFGG